VVGALGGVLHQVHLLQMRRIGKGLVANEEVELAVGIVGLGISVLEVDALHLRLASKALIGHTAQMGVTGEVAHQVVQDIHLAVLWHALLVDRGSGDVGAFGIDKPAVVILIPAVCLRGMHIGVEELGVVVLRDVRVLHTFVSVGVVFTRCTTRHLHRLHSAAVAHQHLVGHTLGTHGAVSLCTCANGCNCQPKGQ